MHETQPKLTPAQQSAKEDLLMGMAAGPVVALGCESARGKTTILKEIHNQKGGGFVRAADILLEAAHHHPLALEDAFYHVVLNAMRSNSITIVDDFQLLQDLVCCHHFYPRGRWLDSPSLALCNNAAERGTTLLLSYGTGLPHTITERAFKTTISKFGVDDYQVLGHNLLPDDASSIDFGKVYRFAPKLTAHQFRAACDWLRPSGKITTESFIEYLRSQRLASNVDLTEVQQVNLKDLIGVEDVIRELEIHVALPLENDRLASEFALRPKRGVLLYGPPGTGKTTVGRALAHRLRSKFFLIDGTFIAGTGDFYGRVQQVFEAAKENAPAVIFIDDADAIFQGGEEQGLYRYLLTMLDGLESESAKRVSVMMTAMDVGYLPLALVRSGRVELWLEMKLPSPEARQLILAKELAKANAIFPEPELAAVVEATERFSGADLKRVVEDARGLYAYDRASGTAAGTSEAYLFKAVQSVALNKQRYAAAEAGARRSSNLPASFATLPAFLASAHGAGGGQN